MINTSRGSKTPAEALALFKDAVLPVGELLGIYKQFKGKEAEEARKCVLANTSSYNDKLQRLAKEQSTGVPIGPKVIRNGDDVKLVLGGLDVGSSVSITFAKDVTPHLSTVLGMARIIQIDSDARMFIVKCVVPSGRWEGIPRTYSALINIRNGGDLEMCQEYLPGAVESIQVHCTRQQFLAANDPCPKILADNPDLFFDAELFKQACARLNKLSEAEGWIRKLGADPSMQEVLEVFPHTIVQGEFLEAYVELFKAALA